MSLNVGETYHWKDSKGWDWFGTERWWEFFVEILGLNGSGGYWIKVKSRWNGSEFMPHLDSVDSLTWEKSKELEEAIRSRQRSSK